MNKRYKKTIDKQSKSCYNDRTKGVSCMVSDLMNNSLHADELYEQSTFFKKVKALREIWTLIKEVKELADKPESIVLMETNIVKDPNFRNGKPVIKGTGISIYDVIRMLHFEKLSIEEIFEQYPVLNKEEQILSAILYYYKYTPIIKILRRTYFF